MGYVPGINAKATKRQAKGVLSDSFRLRFRLRNWYNNVKRKRNEPLNARFCFTCENSGQVHLNTKTTYDLDFDKFEF